MARRAATTPPSLVPGGLSVQVDLDDKGEVERAVATPRYRSRQLELLPALEEPARAPVVEPQRPDPKPSGARHDPYVREDGARMVKTSFAATRDFVELLHSFTGTLTPGDTRCAWIERTLFDGIVRDRGEAWVEQRLDAFARWRGERE